MTETGIISKEQSRNKVAELVNSYKSLAPTQMKTFHEAKTKQGFIQPQFQALASISNIYVEEQYVLLKEIQHIDQMINDLVNYVYTVNDAELKIVEAYHTDK